MKTDRQSVLIICIVTLLFCFRSISDDDFFSQLALGKYLLSRNIFLASILKPDPLNPTLLPAPNIGWAYQYMIAGITRLLGLKAVCIGTYGILAIGMHAVLDGKKFPEYNATIPALFIGSLIILPHVAVRPQVFAVFFFIMALRLLHSYRSAFTVFFISFPLFLLWQSIHPSLLFFSGLILLSETIQWFSAKHFRKSTAILLISSVCAVGLLEYVVPSMAIAKTNAVLSKQVLHISEWQPAWDFSVRRAMTMFFLFTPLSLFAEVRYRSRSSTFESTLRLLFFVITLYSARFGLFWGALTTPLWYHLVRDLFLHFRKDSLISSSIDPFKKDLLFYPVLFTLLSFIWIVSSPLDETSERIKEQITALRSVQNDSGVAYTSKEISGYVSAFSRFTVQVDGRIYRYTEDFWNRYAAESQGAVPLQEISSVYDPEVFILDPETQAPLISEISTSKHWKELSKSPVVRIFTKR